MSVAEVLAEADADLAVVRSVVDTAQHALDVAEATRRTGTRLVARLRTVVVVLGIGAVAVGVVLAVRAVRVRRATGTPDGAAAGDPTAGGAEPAGGDPAHNGSVTPPVVD